MCGCCIDHDIDCFTFLYSRKQSNTRNREKGLFYSKKRWGLYISTGATSYMTEKELRNSGLGKEAIALILNRAEQNHLRYGTPIKDSIRIMYNTLTR